MRCNAMHAYGHMYTCVIIAWFSALGISHTCAQQQRQQGAAAAVKGGKLCSPLTPSTPRSTLRLFASMHGKHHVIAYCIKSQ